MSAEDVQLETNRSQYTDDDAGASVFSWKRTSLSTLAACEDRILSCLTVEPNKQYVTICNGTRRIWTLSFNTSASGTPLVLLHGMGSGVGLWVLNLVTLSRSRPLYAIDLLGFGRSSRSKFSADPAEAELEFVNSIEEWRIAKKLDQMILLGHSLGGFLTASYSIHFSERVKHLILADPWGFPPRPTAHEKQSFKLPIWAKVVRKIIQPFNPFSMLRLVGPWGPSILIKFRSDLLQKFSHKFSDGRIGEYLYHCNAQTPSGEAAFKTMTYQFGWARNPMIHRVHEIPSSVSMTLIYGARSWVDYGLGYVIKNRRPDSYVNVEVIREAGHHVYADQPDLFNSVVCRTCDMIDRRTDVLRPRSPRAVTKGQPDLPAHLKDHTHKTQKSRKQSTSPCSTDHALCGISSTSSCDIDPQNDLTTIEQL